jgi:hypothetical protein
MQLEGEPVTPRRNRFRRFPGVIHVAELSSGKLLNIAEVRRTGDAVTWSKFRVLDSGRTTPTTDVRSVTFSAGEYEMAIAFAGQRSDWQPTSRRVARALVALLNDRNIGEGGRSPIGATNRGDDRIEAAFSEGSKLASDRSSYVTDATFVEGDADLNINTVGGSIKVRGPLLGGGAGTSGREG